MVDRNDANKTISSSSSSSNIHHDNPHPLQSSLPPLMLQLAFLRHGQTTANAMGIVQGHQHFWPLNDIGVAQAKAAGLYLRNHYQRQFCEEKLSMENETGSISEEEEEVSKHPLFWRVYASDLDRASSTAQIALRDANYNDTEQVPSSSSPSATPSTPAATIQSSLVQSNETLRLDERLREYALGAREGRPVRLSWEEAEAEAKKAKETNIPKREYAEDVIVRAKSFLEELYKDAIKELKQRSQQRKIKNDASDPPIRVLIVSHGGFLRTLFDQVLNFDPELRGGRIQNASFTDVNVYYDYDLNYHDDAVENGEENDCNDITEATEDGINGKRIVDRCQYCLGKHVNYNAHLDDLKIDASGNSKDPSLKNEKRATNGAFAATRGGEKITMEDEMNDASVIS